VRSTPDVRVAEGAFLVDLLTDGDGAVTGALLLLPCGTGVAAAGRLTAVRAGAVVLASGGAGQLYADTTNPAAATGDGIAAALRAGADLADLEFVQFHPTALHVRRDPRPLLSEALRGEGAVLRDPRGDPVMTGLHPMGDLAPRDVVTRGMAARMALLGADHLLLDATRLGARTLERRFPTIVAACRAAGLDPASTPLPVSPAAHYLMGGVRTDLDGRTSIPGLFAVGEAAHTGVHGANRLASNSLLEGLVFSRRIAEVLPGELRPWSLPASDARTAGLVAAGVRRELQEVMTSRVGVLRAAGGLDEAGRLLDKLAGVGTEQVDQESWETTNLLTVAAALTAAAALREETRGSHWREDFPSRDDDRWSGHFDTVFTNGQPSTSFRPAAPVGESAP
jgi:L-aspartate oxidase